MKKISKTVMTLISALLCLCMTAMPAMAADTQDNSNSNLVGLSPSPTYLESNDSAKGDSYPKSTWNIASKGQYKFSATNAIIGLYTNYRFTGKKNYTIDVNNKYTDTLSISVYKRINNNNSDRLKVKTLSAKHSITFSVSGLSASDQIFIYFSCTGSSRTMTFTGYIR